MKTKLMTAVGCGALILMLADKITQFIPMRLSPLTSYMDTIVAFGVGAGVYCLATMASHSGSKHH